jgi:hypothetical protein
MTTCPAKRERAQSDMVKCLHRGRVRFTINNGLYTEIKQEQPGHIISLKHQ